MAKYIRYQWAVSGDTSAVPDLTQSDGSVSYQTGYGAPYSIAYGSTGYKAIERTKLNGALNDITGVLQQYQGNGFPDFITSADNGGTPYSYPLNAMIRYDDGGGVAVYQSLIANNTGLPTVTASWKKNPMSFDLASTIHSSTSKTTPLDADEIPIADSATTPTAFGIKKLTWANLKATLLTYFDTLYSRKTSIFGIGQTWQDVTGSRALNTTYTNTTGKPIQVVMYGAPVSTGNNDLIVDGISISSYITNDTPSGASGTISGIVPHGSTYSITGSTAIRKWSELR